MFDGDKELLAKAYNTILLCLAARVLREVVEEKTVVGLWLKLDSRYMTKLSALLSMHERMYADE